MTENKNVLYASAFGTLTAELLTLPICTIKTIYQNNPYFNTVETIKHIYKQNGYIGFFSASTPAIIAQVISTSSKYTFYQKIKEYRKTEKKT